MTTDAENFAARLNNDGQCWETDDGVSFVDLADEMDATPIYSTRAGYTDDDQPIYTDGTSFTYSSVDDPIRNEFPDGSAIVEIGGAWDLEGEQRFSWAGS